jgi:hypothetical protein
LKIWHTTDTKIHLLQAFSLRTELPIQFSGALPRLLLFQAFSLRHPATCTLRPDKPARHENLIDGSGATIPHPSGYSPK